MDEIVTFNAATALAIAATIAAIVQMLKTISERLAVWSGSPPWMKSFFDWWAHTRGPVILSVIVSLFVTTLPPILADGALSWPELHELLEVLGFAAGANAVYWFSRLKSPLKMFKRRKTSK